MDSTSSQDKVAEAIVMLFHIMLKEDLKESYQKKFKNMEDYPDSGESEDEDFGQASNSGRILSH